MKITVKLIKTKKVVSTSLAKNRGTKLVFHEALAEVFQDKVEGSYFIDFDLGIHFMDIRAN